MPFSPPRFHPLPIVLACALGVAAGCVSRGPGSPDDEGTRAAPRALDAAEVARLVPARVPERAAWARAVVSAIAATGKAPTAERACAVLAVIEQESGYQVDPRVPDLPRIVRRGLRERFEALGPLAGPALAALLAAPAPGGEATFGERIDALRSERDLDRLFRGMANAYRNRLPGSFVVAGALSRLLGKGTLEDLNPVTTAGPMQVKIAFARSLPDFEELDDAELRERLYTREGGVRAGAAFLLDYPAAYDDVVYRFADYNAGRYASRNAAFQALVADLTGRPLARDGDLLAYDARGEERDLESRSLSALTAFAGGRGMWASTVRRDARREKEADFEETGLWEEVRDAWREAKGREPPYAALPDVAIVSPKMAARRSTAWFARNVERRYEACRARERGPGAPADGTAAAGSDQGFGAGGRPVGAPGRPGAAAPSRRTL